MKRTARKLCLVAVISLLFSVIWHASASAAVAPSFQPLGEIREGLSAPGRLDVDAAGNIYVTDARKRMVFKFDKYGKAAGSFPAPVNGGGLAVTPDGSRIYVSGRDVVTILDGLTGAVLGQLGAGAGEFNYVGEIDLDAGGRIFVADTGTMFINVYDADGVFQYKFGGFGTAAGQFQSIWAMSVNVQAEEVYVADVMSAAPSYPKLQVFDLAGTLKRSILATSTSFGSPPMTFFGGITFDQFGRGYFPDSFRSQIRVLGLPSTYLSQYAVTGYGVGKIQGPLDTAYDPVTQRLFVTCDGARIEIFGIDGGQNPVNANVKPGLPVPLSPVNDSEVASVNPALLFQNAVDPDANDSITYQVNVYIGETVIAEYANLPEGEGSSSMQVGTALAENARHRWAVQAFDGKDVSGWTALQSFYVNAVQEAPAAPVPVAPAAGETLDGDGVFVWLASADPDPFDTVSYVIEFSDDPGFITTLIEEPVAGTSVSLAALADYAALTDGGSYYWRVKAVDNHGLESVPGAAGDFLYDTTVLQVTANMPGAKVYLGGNHAYDGRFVGETPLTLRDFPSGPCSVLVERAGFEPFVAQVNPVYRENVAIYAELVPAIAPSDLKARPLQAAGVDILLGADAAPFAVDFDNDGTIDLLLGDATGALTLYKGVLSAEGVFYYTAGVSLDLPLMPGATPFVADWDNDGRKDLLVGTADGTVLLYLNTATENAPAFGAASYLQAAGVPVDVGAAAAPVVVDWDGDGDKDLVVGSVSGAVTLFRNDGEDAIPQLVHAGNLAVLSSAVSPFFVDWDADGVDDLLLAASEHLYLYRRQANGTYAPAVVLSVGSDLLGKNGKSSTGAYSMGERLRLFAYDADGKKGKDLIVGNAAGQVRLVRSFGRLPVAAFQGALLDKVAQIDELVRESAAESASLVSEVAAAVESGDLAAAYEKTLLLQAVLVPGTELAKTVAELEVMLR